MRKIIGLGLILLLMVSLSWASYNRLEARLVIPETSLIFSHSFHVDEQEIECTSCHPEIENSKLSSDRNLPTMEECEACHDVDDDETCGMCHKVADEPEELINPDRPIDFNHELHLSSGMECSGCHGEVGKVEILTDDNLPDKKTCMNCHNNVKADGSCEKCHSDKITLTDIHPKEWRHTHAENINFDNEWCSNCHKIERDCLECHKGDNTTGKIHDLNYRLTHGLDANSKALDCQKCHDRENFCNTCHIRELRLPLNHSSLGWIGQHSQAAKNDIENCASCHMSDDLTCARAGCHSDFDGIRGTDPKIHISGAEQFESEGDWHNDNNFYC